MNTNQLQKYYDKLTPRERLAAVLEAGMRGDDRDAEALKRAAPKKNYQVSHHYFLLEAFEQLATTHLCLLLNMGCAFYMGQNVLWSELDEHEDDPAAGLRFDKIFEGMYALAESFKTEDVAWAEFCKGQGMNPEALLMALPGSGVLPPDAPDYMQGATTLPALRQAVEALSPEPPSAEAVKKMVETYQQALDRLAGQQSGGWG